MIKHDMLLRTDGALLDSSVVVIFRNILQGSTSSLGESALASRLLCGFIVFLAKEQIAVEEDLRVFESREEERIDLHIIVGR